MWLFPKAIKPKQLKKKLPNAGAKTAVFYSKDGLLASAQNLQLDFVNQICDLLREFKYSCILVDGTSIDAPEFHDEIDFHFWMIERPPVCAERPEVFHVFPAYLRGFWYFDKKGVRNNSSLADRQFTPSRMSQDWSKKVFEDLRARFVETGLTKFDQSPQGKFTPPPDCIAVAVQSFAQPKFYETYIQYPELIHAAISASGGRPVAIKPHPMLNFRTVERLFDLHDPANGIYVEPYNLHELLSRLR